MFIHPSLYFITLPVPVITSTPPLTSDELQAQEWGIDSSELERLKELYKSGSRKGKKGGGGKSNLPRQKHDVAALQDAESGNCRIQTRLFWKKRKKDGMGIKMRLCRVLRTYTSILRICLSLVEATYLRYSGQSLLFQCSITNFFRKFIPLKLAPIVFEGLKRRKKMARCIFIDWFNQDLLCLQGLSPFPTCLVFLCLSFKKLDISIEISASSCWWSPLVSLRVIASSSW